LAALTSGTRLGPYEILALIGSGGMGEVYRARDTRLEREVAVKVLPSQIAADLERLRRFAQEARASAALERIVDRCLQKRPEARYQQAHDVLTDLRTLKRTRDSAAAARSSGSVVKATPSIAMLPFSDMSPQKDQDYFCEGMAEELINALGALPGLRVASRTSAFQFKGQAIDIGEIGAKLRVETVLEGSVRKAGNRMRIAVQLVNTTDGYHVWSERYDRDADDVFAVQDDIARAVVEKLKVKLTPDAETPMVKHGTADLDAYHLYLQGRYCWCRRGGFLEKAVDCFARAIERDPSYAQAHAGLADAYGVLGIYGVLPPADAARKARPAAERALALDNTLAEAHRSLAVIHVSFEWNLAGGEREYRRALDLNPRSGELRAMLAYCLTYLQRSDEALAENRRARDLEPESVLVAGYNAVNLMFCRQYAEALDECRRCLDLDPGFATAEWIRAQVLTLLGDHESAIAAAERALALTGRQSFYLSAFGMACAAAGRRADAEQVIQELLDRSRAQYVSPLWLADITTALGDAERALDWLERAYAARTQALISLGVSPLYDSLRHDGRFSDLLNRIGIAGVAPVRAGGGPL
jgi:serine/threonine-protein kinase